MLVTVGLVQFTRDGAQTDTSMRVPVVGSCGGGGGGCSSADWEGRRRITEIIYRN